MTTLYQTLFTHPLAQSLQESQGFSFRRALDWFLEKDAVSFQIPLVGGITLGIAILILLARLIRRQQNLGFSYDRAEKHGEALHQTHAPGPKQDLPALRPSRKRALSPVEPEIEHPRGPLRFGPSKDTEKESEPLDPPQK